MFSFSRILIGLQAAIAAKAARDRTLTALLVALYGRIARMATRLDRLIGLWRAGKLPKPRPSRAGAARPRVPRQAPDMTFPTSPGWLRRRLGTDVGAYASQLQHLLTEAECAEFLQACPQAGRILRPLLRMLSFDPLPDIIRRAVNPMVQAPAPERVGIAVSPTVNFLRS